MRSHPTLIWVVLVSLAACTASDRGGMSGDVFDPASTPTWEEYLAHATPLHDGQFLTEGDLFFPNEQALHDHYNLQFGRELVPKAHVWAQVDPAIGAPIQLRFPLSVAVDIQYCVAKADFDAVNPAYYARAVADVAAAAAEWEAQANVSFKHVSSLDATAQCTAGNPDPIAPVDFVVGPFNEPGVRGCADPSWLRWDDESTVGKWPACPYGTAVRGAPGPAKRWAFDILVLDYKAITDQASTGITGTGVARHELGHKLGFSHEHVWTPGGNPCNDHDAIDPSFQALPIHSGLPAYDPTSVMHYPGEYCDPPNPNYGPDIGYKLSMMDGYSARALYGMPVSWQIATGLL